MSRGFLVGAGWGTVVAGIGLVVASQVSELTQAPPATSPTQVGAPQASVAPSPVIDEAPVEPLTDLAEPPAGAIAAPSAPVMEKPETVIALQPDLPSESVDSEITSAPNAIEAATQESAPQAAIEGAELPEAQVSVATPEAPQAVNRAPEPPAKAVENTIDPTRNTSDLPENAERDTAPLPLSDPAALPEPDTDMQPADDTAVNSFVVDPALNVVPPEVLAPQTEAVDDAPAARPAPGFSNDSDGVTVGRLPTITPAAEAETTVLVDQPVLDDPDLPPVERFARPFTNSGAKPLFAILLQDTGGPDLDRESLAAIPFPVSFVIDPSLPDAATAAAIYRAAGQEVLMLASGIPANASASDLSVSFEAMSATLPESVAVVDLQQGGFQGNLTLAAQVIGVIQDQGRGIISWDRGLNAASQVARREGVRNATIFRPLDTANEGSPVIRRYLDRAAFKAAQDGRVMVMGHTRPDTVTALLEWAVEGRAATVAIAPSTAVMTRQ